MASHVVHDIYNCEGRVAQHEYRLGTLLQTEDIGSNLSIARSCDSATSLVKIYWKTSNQLMNFQLSIALIALVTLIRFVPFMNM